MSDQPIWQVGKLRLGKVTCLQSQSLLATESLNQAFCLSLLCFSSALCCITFPRSAAKNGAEALGKNPELMTQCYMNGKLLSKRRTSPKVQDKLYTPYPNLCSGTTLPLTTAAEKQCETVGSEKCTSRKRRWLGAKTETANFRDFLGIIPKRVGLTENTHGQWQKLEPPPLPRTMKNPLPIWPGALPTNSLLRHSNSLDLDFSSIK